ncbi:MAG: UDP-4-amino-4,6-dideoxy-N-acetyl-beta-L-altrosamine N-acetyltransferase [bacterium]
MIPGEKITLRAIEKRDVEFLRNLRNKPEMRKYLCSHMPISEIQQVGWYERSASDARNQIFMVDDPAGETVGYVQLTNIDYKNRSVEIGIHLGPSAQGKGYGRDAFHTLMRFAFEEMNMHRVYLYVFAFNERAIGLYEKLGFREEGRLRDSVFQEGRYQDIVLMSILESEFADRSSP